MIVNESIYGETINDFDFLDQIEGERTEPENVDMDDIRPDESTQPVATSAWGRMRSQKRRRSFADGDGDDQQPESRGREDSESNGLPQSLKKTRRH